MHALHLCTLQARQRDYCAEVRESATKRIVCKFSACAFLLLIIEDLKQLLVFILKALQLGFFKKSHIHQTANNSELIAKGMLGLLDFSDFFFLGFRVVSITSKNQIIAMSLYWIWLGWS